MDKQNAVALETPELGSQIDISRNTIDAFNDKAETIDIAKDKRWER